MSDMTVEATARLLEADPSELLATIAVGLEFLGADALEVHGDIRGRGFIARRDHPDTREWRIRLAAPQQVSREPDGLLFNGELAEALAVATERIAGLDAENAVLRTALQEASADLVEERELRLRLEGRVAALEEHWERLQAVLEQSLGARASARG